MTSHVPAFNILERIRRSPRFVNTAHEGYAVDTLYGLRIMSYNVLATRTGSPAISSRAASPVPQIIKRANHDASLKNDKAYRRYATTLEKTLATWEIAPEEWADYIAFLSRLLKAIQSGAAGATTLPHSDAVASKLAQCLNPGLPSGVHSKALEVYAYIFSSFGKDYVASQLHDYLPGLFPLLSFTSLSVRPALYDLLEDYVVCLEPSQLRSVLKSFILSILPALEDENSEDFDRALTTITHLERSFVKDGSDDDLKSFYWQSVFLSIVTSPSRRQGALNYLVRRLPKFVRSTDSALPVEVEAIISPEPGLLIRAFACGLTDSQLLIQRGFLDLLTTHIPLDSPLLQNRIGNDDFQLLVSAALTVLLRRDMSLNRRVWQWLLGPEAKEEEEQIGTSKQLQYISKYGLGQVERCLHDTFVKDVPRLGERVKPFRISLSLMDRWEIGGSIVPKVFLPAMNCAYLYSKTISPSERIEFKKSVSLFFDGVESHLIWSCLLALVNFESHSEEASKNLDLLIWILSEFNVKEEEMATIHAPLLTIYTLDSLIAAVKQQGQSYSIDGRWFVLIELLTATTVVKDGSNHAQALPTSEEASTSINQYYNASAQEIPYTTTIIQALLLQGAGTLLYTLHEEKSKSVPQATAVYIHMVQMVPRMTEDTTTRLLESTERYLELCIVQDDAFLALSSVTDLLHAIWVLPAAPTPAVLTLITRLASLMTPILLRNISPSRSRYSVEAVKVLWRLNALLEKECIAQAALQRLVNDNDLKTRKDSIRIFLNLWNLSMSQQTTAAKSSTPGSMRRASSSTMTTIHENNTARSHTLHAPLMIALDTLNNPSDAAFDDVNIWLNSSVHTEAALLILFEQLRDALNTQKNQFSPRHTSRLARASDDGKRSLRYALGHFDSILKHAQPTFWAVLSSCHLPGSRPAAKHPALTALIEQCLMLLSGDSTDDQDIHLLAASILDRTLSAPAFARIVMQVPDFGTIVCEKLLAYLDADNQAMQTRLLELSIKALTWQETALQPSQAPPRAFVRSRKMSLVGSLPAVDEIHTSPVLPKDLLVQLLKTGLSSTKCSPYLDTWVRLAEEVLHLIGADITVVLIPLTEIVCKQVSSIFDQMLDNIDGPESTAPYAPEATITRLLDCAELFLQATHQALLQDEAKDQTTQAEGTSTVLANITPNLFKTQGAPSRTSKANSRLTAILASKDVARICIRIWLWTSHAESADPDRQTAGSVAHAAQRLKARTRHMLEELFSLEPLESLEVVATQWLQSNDKDSIISVLHVLRDVQPKNTVPAILDALCSRTNPALLVPSRQSTLTSDLTAAELTLFYSAYLDSLEDDAVEEIWSDCTAFLRDVLSNPLPHRQILPALIWIVFQLAQKLENTNYGERRRMKRELGDNFQRLLAATFAALPSGSIDVDGSGESETPFSSGLHNMSLTVILREVIGRAELILETADRVALCINTVSVHLVTPALRSKTFPARVNADVLALILRIAKKSPGAKVWRKDITDAFNDPRFIAVSPHMVEHYWFPILQQWIMTDKEKFTEIIARLYAPTSAGIMFGVGASAARLDADRKTQFNLRRIALLLLAAPADSHIENLKAIQEKIVELFEASLTSSPSSAIKAELFMLIRALMLSTSAVYFASLWPIVNDQLKAALLGLDLEDAPQNNLSLLQACKLLDMLAAVAPDDFQLFEWIYITNTTDAVYHQHEWTSIALSDNLGIAQMKNGIDEEVDKEATALSSVSQADGLRRPLIVHGAGYDTEDIKAMARETFVNTALRPFLSQMSISMYESRYRLEQADTAAFRHALLEDLQDAATVVST